MDYKMVSDVVNRVYLIESDLVRLLISFRNVTCYYYIRQAWSPKNQTILLTLVQTEPGQSFSVRTSDAGDKERKMLSGRDCRPHVDDTLSIYNGATIESPLLARLCGTGDMPAITGAGGELLVVFRSQPHDAPFNPAPLGASPGFRLMTRVRFVPSSQVRHYHPECRLSLASSGSNSRRSQRQGIIRSPEVTLAPNSTCLYDFTGREDQRVWITFLSYRLEGVLDDADCLTLTDGQEVVSRQCGNSVQPRICPHALVHANASTAYKPCRWQDGESYLSRTPHFAIRQDLATGTTLRPWSFVIRFEFVTVDRFSSLMGGGGGGSGGGGDGRPDAESANADATPISAGDDDQSVTEMTTPDCFQLLESRNGNGSVSSPRNPMLYGRGGSRHLRCLYRFQVIPFYLFFNHSPFFLKKKINENMSCSKLLIKAKKNFQHFQRSNSVEGMFSFVSNYPLLLDLLTICRLVASVVPLVKLYF